MKTLILFMSLFITATVVGQNLYKAESGKVKFFSDALLEDIEATTTNTTAALNAMSGDVAVLIPIKSFEFNKSLMREHFNEKYLESDKYPDASFKGKITQRIFLTPGSNFEVNISGELSIHGVSRHREIVARLKVASDGTLQVSGKFDLKVAEHDVKIPTLVFQNIAEIVEVSFAYTLRATIHQ